MQAGARPAEAGLVQEEVLVEHDLIVIGESMAAYTAAIDARQLGLDVLFVLPPISRQDPDRLSPKLRSALTGRILTSSSLSNDLSPLAPDVAQDVRRRVDDDVNAHLDSLRLDLEKFDVHPIYGRAHVRGPRQVEVESELHNASAVLVSESTRSRRPKSFRFDDHVICDWDSAVNRSELPRSVAIVGANHEGCELACFFAKLGAEVVLIDRRASMMRGVDRDLLRVLHAQMQAAGVGVILQEEIEGIRVNDHPEEPHAVLTLSSGRIEKCECVVVCAGRIPSAWHVDLRDIDLARDWNGFLVTDEVGCTSCPGLYAIGEVSGVSPDLGTQVHRARVSVLDVAGEPAELDERAPVFLYTIPEIASVGLTEEACRRLDVPCVAGVSIYPARVRRGAEGAAGGFLKLVAELESERLLGVHIIGTCAGDSLQLGLEYVRRGASVRDVVGALFNTPGPAEAYRLAACDALARLATTRES